MSGLTAEQMALKRTKLGSSEIAAVFGLSRYTSRWKLWASKMPDDHPAYRHVSAIKKDPWLDVGKRLEPVVADWCSELYEPLTRYQKTIPHPTEGDWLVVTPDYVNQKLEPWEIKAWRHLDRDYAEVQLRTQISGMGAARGFIGFWERDGDSPPEKISIERDLGLEETLLEGAKDFWFRYVVPRVEPPDDGCQEYGRFLGQMPFAIDGDAPKTLTVDETHEITQAMKTYRTAQETAKVQDQIREQAFTKLKKMTVELGKVVSPLGTLYRGWTERPDETDWETVSRRLMGILLQEIDGHPAPPGLIKDCEAIIAEHTKKGTRYRHCIPKWTKS